MAEIRLNKLIKQFNIGLDTLVDFLNSKGAGIEHASPNTKVSDVFLPDLHRKFCKDLELKEVAEKVDVNLTEALDKVARKTEGIPEQDQRIMVKRPSSVAPEEFDWDAFEAECVTDNSREEVLDLYDNSLHEVAENDVVEGVVTSINKREVVVNIGARHEGVISAPEFRYNPDLKVGDKVEVFVEELEDRHGCLIISHKKARQLKSWDMVNAAYENNEMVKGYVKTRTKGGMIVDIFGIEAFLPGSQIDTKPVKDFDSYVDTTMDFKIVKVNQDFRNVVVSHRALLEDDDEREESNLAAKQAVIEDLKALIDERGDMKEAFPKFREIQIRWRETGPVPQQNYRDVNDTYQLYVEKFYDLVQINRELRDLDFRANLEAKTELCEQAEALDELDDVVLAYNELQKLHAKWKEIGPVAKEFRDAIWERFRAATAIINRKYQAYRKEKGIHKKPVKPSIQSKEVEGGKASSDTPVGNAAQKSPAPEIDPSTFFSVKAKRLLQKKGQD